jgi:glutamine synthetase
MVAIEKTKLREITNAVQNTEYIILHFTDLLGAFRGRTIPSSEVTRVINAGIGFDGSSIPGFVNIEESDMVMKADPKTFTILPSYFYNRPVASFICNILKPGGGPYESDPRHICRKTMQKVQKEGFEPTVAAEVEFYLVKEENGEFVPVENHLDEKHRYFDILPGRDLTEPYRMDLCDALAQMGMTIERQHHEVGPAQNEITFKYGSPVETSDNIMRYKYAAKAVAQRKYGWIATFMPKPWIDLAGNGMHVHVGLFQRNKEKNTFYNDKGYAHMSQTCLYFVGGILHHARALSAIVAPTVNSYKRLIPGYEAPVYITWSRRNRSALVRIPEYFPTDKNEVRLEFRCPDTLCNPYLAFSAILEAGMDGVKKKIDPGDPLDKNTYRLTEDQRRKLGIKTLPSSLLEALEEWKSDDICIKALGRENAEKYLELKMKEWKEYKRHARKNSQLKITLWEVRKYFFA